MNNEVYCNNMPLPIFSIYKSCKDKMYLLQCGVTLNKNMSHKLFYFHFSSKFVSSTALQGSLENVKWCKTKESVCVTS